MDQSSTDNTKQVNVSKPTIVVNTPTSAMEVCSKRGPDGASKAREGVPGEGVTKRGGESGARRSVAAGVREKRRRMLL